MSEDVSSLVAAGLGGARRGREDDAVRGVRSRLVFETAPAKHRKGSISTLSPHIRTHITMSDAAAASTSAPAADQKQVKLTSADNEEFKVDHEVVSGPTQRLRGASPVSRLIVKVVPCYTSQAVRSVLIKNMLEGELRRSCICPISRRRNHPHPHERAASLY